MVSTARFVASDPPHRAAPGAAPASAPMTIDALAIAANTTTRNVRSLQTRGLLPPPVMVGRVGHYDAAHLERLQLIARLQERGYSLAAIGDLIAAWHEQRSVAELLGCERELSPVHEEPIEATLAELMQRFTGLTDALVARAIELELVVPLPAALGEPPRVRVPSPRLLEVGRALQAIGIPLAVALDQLAILRESTSHMANALVSMFANHIVQPWARAGHSLATLPELVDRIRRAKPLPLVAVESLLQQAIEREVERVMATIVPRP